MKPAGASMHLTLACTRLRTWLGLDLERGGVMANVERHVTARLAVLGDPSLNDFAHALRAPTTNEARRLIEAATVPYSWLWRDGGQLEALGDCLAHYPRRPLRVWVPACASGEDAYSVAALALSLGFEVSVLGTDVHHTALAQARDGRYGGRSCRELPAAMRHFLPEDPPHGAVASGRLRACVSFAWHSLLDEPPGGRRAAWDVVVCRNALIYFDVDTTQAIVDRLAATLAPGGLLVLGSSDTFSALPTCLKPTPAGRLVLVREQHREIAPPAPPPPAAQPPAQLPEDEVALPALLASAQKRLDDDLTDAEAQLTAGLVLHMQGHYETSIVRLRATTCLAPGAWAAWFYLGLGFERIGLRREARRAFRQVALARGEGDDLPRGSDEFARTLHAARSTCLRIASAKATTLDTRRRQP